MSEYFWLRRKLPMPALLILAILALVGGAFGVARACPFCSAPQQTFSEEIRASAAAVIAKLVNPGKVEDPAATESSSLNADPDGIDLGPAPDSAKAQFEIVEVLKGADVLQGKKLIDVIYYGQQPKGTKFYITAVDPKDIAWSTPVALTDASAKYMSEIVKLPESGSERLVFYQEHLEGPEQMLMNDAYDEFAKTPYKVLTQIKDRMHREKLLEWIQNKDIPSSRRRLYLTLLGVCGQPSDVPVLEAMLKSEDQYARTALDALIFCYLQLKGPEGMELVENEFFKKTDAEYTDTYAAVVALRILGEESDTIPKDRLKLAMRHLLSRPNLADLIIPDLARWKDWEVMDQLVELFRTSDQEENSWVRVPVVNFMQAVPKNDPANYARAQKHLETLRGIDADAVKRAADVFSLRPAGANATRAGDPNASETADPPAPPPSEVSEKAEKSNEEPSQTAAVQNGAVPPTDALGGAKAPETQDTSIKKESAEPGTLASLPKSEDTPGPPAARGGETPAGASASDRTTTWLAIGGGAIGVAVLLMLIVRPRRPTVATGAHTQ